MPLYVLHNTNEPEECGGVVGERELLPISS
jgi:hypothetical protein